MHRRIINVSKISQTKHLHWSRKYIQKYHWKYTKPAAQHLRQNRVNNQQQSKVKLKMIEMLSKNDEQIKNEWQREPCDNRTLTLANTFEHNPWAHLELCQSSHRTIKLPECRFHTIIFHTFIMSIYLEMLVYVLAGRYLPIRSVSIYRSSFLPLSSIRELNMFLISRVFLKFRFVVVVFIDLVVVIAVFGYCSKW